MAEPKPIELYFWPTPNGRKITVFLEEAGYPYEIRWVNIRRGEQFDPDFLAIAPNNRMPAIVDPEGPDGKPISIFESGAILTYLGRKTGKFYPSDERGRVKVDEWVMWQMANLGPAMGQNNHFRSYAQDRLDYAIKRFGDEVHRLFGVVDTQLEGRDFVTGDYTIADMLMLPWMRSWERHGIDIAEFPNVGAWLKRLEARPATARGLAVGEEKRTELPQDPEARKFLFGQRARGRTARA